MLRREWEKELKDLDKVYRVLDVDGNLIDKKHKPSISKKDLLKGYEYMVLSRQQDTYMIQLQRQGRMLTFAPNLGEEALQVASALPLTKKDWFVPAFRSNAAMLLLGVPVLNQMVYWNGNEEGSKIPEGVNVLPTNIPIATQISHAAGIAQGIKYKKEKAVAVTFIGNGGTAEGEFYEAINMAAIHKWPAVFCVNNNKWAISTPEELETQSPIFLKAAAFGIPSIKVDGNDLLASYEAMKEAVEYAKEGNGPILIEFMTWRQGQHTTSDDPSLYRTKEQEKEEEKWEPFHRIEKYMIDHKIMTSKEIEKLKEEKLEEVKKAYQESLKVAAPTVDDVFDYTYETLPEELKVQKQEAKTFAKEAK